MGNNLPTESSIVLAGPQHVKDDIKTKAIAIQKAAGPATVIQAECGTGFQVGRQAVSLVCVDAGATAEVEVIERQVYHVC